MANSQSREKNQRYRIAHSRVGFGGSPALLGVGVVPAPSLGVCDNESPGRGPSKGVSVGVRRPSTGESECDEEKWVDVGMSPTTPGRCRVVEPTACASANRENSGLKDES